MRLQFSKLAAISFPNSTTFNNGKTSTNFFCVNKISFVLSLGSWLLPWLPQASEVVQCIFPRSSDSAILGLDCFRRFLVS